MHCMQTANGSISLPYKASKWHNLATSSKERNMPIIFLFLIISWQSLEVNTMSVEVNNGLKVLTLAHDKSIKSSELSKAVLKRDPKASLPISFTICSTIMAPHVFAKQDLVFARVIRKDGNTLINIAMQIQTTAGGAGNRDKI